jgi:prepilin-type N-terminal cleavage/methylation domain-containing protein
MNPRRGFTLVELLMGLIIMGLVAAALTRVFISQQRLTIAQVEQASMQSNVRVGTQILVNELKEIGTGVSGGNDIKNFSSTQLSYRAMRSLALACFATNSPSPRVYIRKSKIFGARPIIAVRDSMLLFIENSGSTASDDDWEQLPINSISNATCPVDGDSAYRLNTNTIPNNAAGIRADAPVRTFEIMEVAPVLAGDHNWLGAHSLTDPDDPPLTPVAGPITLSGMAFAYLDLNGNPTGTRSNIRSIRITLRGQSDWDVRPGSTIGVPLQPLLDSLVTTVTLRNARQP